MGTAGPICGFSASRPKLSWRAAQKSISGDIARLFRQVHEVADPVSPSGRAPDMKAPGAA